jgi:signal transduction histidine kinase/CheY-like chemotaxis protein
LPDGYLVALIGTGLVASARAAFGSLVGGDVPLLPFVLPVMVAAWYGGLGPGLVATAAGAAVGTFLFVTPTNDFLPLSGNDRVRLAIFLTEGTVISYLSGALHAARREAEGHAKEALDKQRQLEDADRHKNEFLATLAHELRNPLSAIRYALAPLRLGRVDPEVLQRSLATAERATALILRLVDDLADLTRISRGRLGLKAELMDLADAVTRAVEASRPVVDGHRHRLAADVPDPPVPVRADVARLTQVVLNLLTNSAKYTPEGGDIRLSLRAEGGEAVIRVRDNGVGIPPDQLPRIFELYSQVQRNIGRSEGGLGIGLALVRNLVEMHGGTVRAFSDGPGTGCEFVVRLPLAADATLPRRVESGPPTPRRILIVDDNRDAADSLAALLRMAEHEVRTAYDGPEGLRVAAESPPEVVFLDIGLPGMSGYELARQLRELPSMAGTAMVAVSGRGSDGDRDRSEKEGFLARLVKPVEYATLARLLAELPVAPAADPVPRHNQSTPEGAHEPDPLTDRR